MRAEMGLALGMLLVFALAVLTITSPEAKNCKRTGATRSTTSIIIVGPVLVPHTFQQPMYKCSEEEKPQ